jgi:uncharacterized protein (DUF983 family)
MTKKMGMVKGVLSNKCPFCNEGAVFKGLITMNKRCPACDAIFLKEEGYFLGSMIAAYFFSAFTVIPVFVIGAFVYQLEISVLIWISSIQVILLSPVLYRYATILWLWVETVLNQKLDDADQK